MGSNRTRPTETAISTMIAIRKRIATNEIGGRSRNPILITSHVELQTTQSVSHASGTPHPALDCQLSFGDMVFIFVRSTIACWLPFVKASRELLIRDINALSPIEETKTATRRNR